jgi:hypothetical protein
MWTQRIMWIAWPAFMAACALELVVFAFADPGDLQWGGHPLALSRQGVYTVAFFVFWIVSMGACALTTLLRMTPAEINECPFDPAQRPEGCPGRG